MTNKRVLIVEEDFPLLLMYTEILKNAGHTVHQASTMIMAYEYLGQHPYDLCFSNLEIDWSGDSVLVVLLHSICRRKGVRMLIISGEESTHQLCQKLGIEFHMKPIVAAELLQLIEQNAAIR